MADKPNPPSRKSPPLLLVGLALVGAAIAAYFALRSPEPTAQPAPPPVAKEEPAQPADAPLPPPEQRDTSVRGQLSDVSPALGQYLGQRDLLERWVQIANNLAEDRSPREPLSFLPPPARFTAAGGKIDERSYSRYNWFGQIVASVDARKFAAAVQTLRPILTTAYHTLGYPKGNIDDLARKSLGRLVRAPLVEGPIEVVQSGAVYKFKDSHLESLGAVEKHLLRMGPQNEKIVQQKASEILEALGLQSTAKQP
ncbi:MAG: DUF3014 domain-containing protein [Myxococcales bacterium]